MSPPPTFKLDAPPTIAAREISIRTLSQLTSMAILIDAKFDPLQVLRAIIDGDAETPVMKAYAGVMGNRPIEKTKMTNRLILEFLEAAMRELQASIDRARQTWESDES